MPTVVVGLAVLALWLYCLFDVITMPDGETRNLPKVLWVLIVVFLGPIGGTFWLLLGRPRGPRPAGPTPPQPPRRKRPEPPKGPDDDPDFLKDLDRRLRNDD
jgi:hypothetical protein